MVNKQLPNLLMVAVMCAVVAANVLCCAVAQAQAKPKPLYQQTPYDVLEVSNGKQYECYPLTLSNRYNISIPKTGNLKLQLIDPANADADPGEVTIPWRLVKGVTIFENLLLQKANELTRAEAFDEAFHYFAHLEYLYPKTPNLERSIQSYLYASALGLYKQNRLPEALSALEELYSRNSKFENAPGQTATSAISSITDKLLTRYVGQGDINSTRRMLTRLTRTYGASQISSVPKWTKELDRRAAVHRDKAKQLMEAMDYRAAYLETVEMIRIWPAVAGGIELAKEAARQYPIVRVGVVDRAGDTTPRQIDNWAGRRVSRLKNRLLVEYVEPGPSGGIYNSPYGKLEQNDDLTAVYFDLRRPTEEGDLTLTAFDLADQLLDRAEPTNQHYSQSWASLLEGVEVRNPFELTIQFRRSNVLPESYLQIPLHFEGELAALGKGGYVDGKSDETQTQYLRDNDYVFRGGTQPAEILEIVYEHTSDAVNDMRNGKLDVIDRLHPSDAARLMLEGSLEVKVGRYAEPTIHVLVPNLDHPHLARDAFRRALIYAIPREKILNTMLLEGMPMDGARVINSVFTTDSYGYDTSVPPMPFDASLGKLLTLVANNELEQIAEKKEEEPPQYEPLVIGHPPTKIARMVTSAIEAQLNSLGIACSREEFPPGVVRDEDGSCDLVFAEIQAPEPIVDAERLLSSLGLAKSPSPYLGMGIARLNRAQDWKDVSARLKDLHRASMQNVALIPLWQVPEHFAYRVGVHGLNPGILSLYQDIEQWQIEPQLEESP